MYRGHQFQMRENVYSRTGVTIIATHTVGSNSWNSGNRVTDDVFNNLKKWSE